MTHLSKSQSESTIAVDTKKASKLPARPSNTTLALIFSVFLWFLSGMIALCVVEGHHGITAMYVLIQMITTIGYGDVTVQTSDGMKLFLSFHVLFCCVVVGGAIMSAADALMQTAEETIAHRMEKLGNPSRTASRKKKMSRRGMILAFLPTTDFQKALTTFSAILLLGTAYYAIGEQCTCSFAESLAEDCDPDNCEATGGYTKTVLDAFYMCVVSLTTVGFGDYAPRTEHGRIFAMVWMIGGVAAVGNFVVQFSKTFVEAAKKSKQLHIDIEDVFEQIDTDGNGRLDKFEFLVFALMEYGLVDQDDVDAIYKQFEAIDVDGSGEVSREEILYKYTQTRHADAEEYNGGALHRLTASLGVTPVLVPEEELHHAHAARASQMATPKEIAAEVGLSNGNAVTPAGALNDKSESALVSDPKGVKADEVSTNPGSSDPNKDKEIVEATTDSVPATTTGPQKARPSKGWRASVKAKAKPQA